MLANKDVFSASKTCARVALVWSQNTANNYASSVGSSDFVEAKRSPYTDRGDHYVAISSVFDMLVRNHIQFDIIDEDNIADNASSKLSSLRRNRRKLEADIKDSLNKLQDDYDIIILEGAGSPAEINMYDKDLANMLMARITNADVLLVADIDQGGVFASIVGTYYLIPEEDRKRINEYVPQLAKGDSIHKSWSE